MSFLEVLFWGSLGAVAYVYAGYPAVLWLWCRGARPVGESSGHEAARVPASWPMVTLIIAAYKEERVILARLHNAILQDYPADRLEILVGCDGDEDLTGDLVRSFHDSRVRLVQYPQRRGKSSVLNDTVPHARGSILVFSDANTMMAPHAVRKLVERMWDPEVGGVCGKLVLIDPHSGGNVDGVYWRYENYLKRCEGKLGMLLGANGANYAIRKELYQPIPANTLNDDFLIGMQVHAQGKRLVYEDAATAVEETAASIHQEFHRRARIGAGGFQSLYWLRALLDPRRGRIAFAFWSHKVLRWMCPLFLIVALAANAALLNDAFYVRVLLLHELFYVAAAAGLWFLKDSKWRPLVRLPAMFVSMNAALLVGLWRWCTKSQLATWKRTDRSEESEPRETQSSSSAETRELESVPS